MTTDIIQVSPQSLTLHPALANFPGLSDDQHAALENSVKVFGILTPLVADAERRVYDGRTRLRIAQVLELPSIPVAIRPEPDVLAVAIESAVARRQLTRSGIAFLLFEQHPQLVKERNKGGRPKKLAGIQPVSGQELGSYRDLALRYRVPREHFGYLAEMHAGMEAEQWAELRRLVLFEEASIPRQYAGFRTGQPAGAQRGAVIYAALNAQGELDGILPRAFASLRNGWEKWRDVPTDAKAAVEKEWELLLEDAPEELLKIAARKGARRG
jgi:hypothetical protein